MGRAVILGAALAMLLCAAARSGADEIVIHPQWVARSYDGGQTYYRYYHWKGREYYFDQASGRHWLNGELYCAPAANRFVAARCTAAGQALANAAARLHNLSEKIAPPCCGR